MVLEVGRIDNKLWCFHHRQGLQALQKQVGVQRLVVVGSDIEKLGLGDTVLGVRHNSTVLQQVGNTSRVLLLNLLLLFLGPLLVGIPLVLELFVVGLLLGCQHVVVFAFAQLHRPLFHGCHAHVLHAIHPQMPDKSVLSHKGGVAHNALVWLLRQMFLGVSIAVVAARKGKVAVLTDKGSRFGVGPHVRSQVEQTRKALVTVWFRARVLRLWLAKRFLGRVQEWHG